MQRVGEEGTAHRTAEKRVKVVAYWVLGGGNNVDRLLLGDILTTN